MPRSRHRMNMFGASVAGLINAEARSDDEARARVWRLFGSILALFFSFDLACALVVTWIQCSSSSQEDNDHHCWRESVLHPFGNRHELGDWLTMAVLRCIMTLLLLWCGVRFGQGPKPIDEEEATSPATTSTSATSSDDERVTPIGEQTTDDLTAPLLSEETNTTEGENESSNMEEETQRYCCKPCPPLQPTQTKNLVLVCLFICSTAFQVYAGLRVATYDSKSQEQDHSSTVAYETIVPLLCLTVLWINAEAYVFRTLLGELTREDGLFLPPEVHRHPMYFENGRGLGIHWCDLCRQRIGGRDKETACYRCSLCDFDVCMKCARRPDAATVGENVLRGDRGVRAEAAMTTGSYIKRSLQVAHSELPLLSVSFLLLALSSVSQLLLPHFQGTIIDKVIPDKNDGSYDKEGFRHYITIYLVVMLAQGAVSTLYSAIFTLVSRRLKFTIRNALLEQMLSQDVAYFDGTESGRLISCLTNDLDLMMSPIQSSLSSLLSNVLILIGGMIMCFVKSYRLSMLAFVTVGPISYLWEQYALWSKGLAREMLSYWAEGNGIASQALSQVRTVKAFGCEDRVLQKYTETNQQALRCGVKDAWGNGITSALTGYLDLGAGVLILYYGGMLVYRGEMSVGTLVTFQLFFNMMNGAYQNLQGLITSFTRSAAGAEKVFSLWDSRPDIDPKVGNDIDWSVEGRIEFQNTRFFYQMRPDNIVLEDFSLDIPAGKTMALVGRSGGGKSTIINMLLRFYDPKGGKLLVDGRGYETLKVHQLRRLFGVVTQETELFPLTVEENIAYGLDPDDYTIEEVIQAATKACAHDFITEMKDGYQTRIGERGSRISGGQRQRLAIARVFLRKPRIILLDEATSALDEVSQEAVQSALATLIEESNATVVLVAHRLSTVVNADCICVIDKGSVLEKGNHDELVAKGGIYATMVSKQLKKQADVIDQEQQDESIPQTKTVVADDIDTLLNSK